MNNLDTKIKKAIRKGMYILLYTAVVVLVGISLWETVGVRDPMVKFFEGEPVVYERVEQEQFSSEADKIINSYMKSPEGQEHLRLWAEKKYLEEQSVEIEKRKEELRKKELSLI